jgi:hypothetical protein
MYKYIKNMTNLKPIHHCNTFAYWNNNNTNLDSICTFIDVYGNEGRANYFSKKSPNELSNIIELKFVAEVYRIY